MVGILHRLGPIPGVGAALGLVWLVAWGLAGSGQAVAGHAVLGLVAALSLALALRRPALRHRVLPGALVLAALTSASALLPSLITPQAMARAAGRPFCLVAPEVATDPDAGRDRVYPIAPSLLPRNLTLLTLPRPLTLAVWTVAPDPDTPRGDKPDPVFETWTLRLSDRGFVQSEGAFLHGMRLSVLLDCQPTAQPFDMAAPQPAAVVVYRPALQRADGTPDWGPRGADLYRLPPGSRPFHSGRFTRAELGFDAPVLPDGGTLTLTIRYLDAPADWLTHLMARHVRDADAPLDFATLPINALGLHALEYPSTSVAGAIDGTYAAFAPDSSARTVIVCHSWSCTHEFLPKLPHGPARLTVTVAYPPDHLPDWQAIEARATAAVAAALTLP